MTTNKKQLGAIILASVLVVGVAFSAVTSLVTVRSLGEIKISMGLTPGGTQEDDIAIMDNFWIRSTTQISDAYRSGSDSGLSDRDKETLEMASAVLDEIITEDMTPYEKELAVYDWMTTQLSYDTGVLQVIPQTREDCDNPYGTLKYHNAVCVGYATTFRMFMQMMDIECMVIHSTDLVHSWNLVKLDNAWYHVDIYSDQGAASYASFNMNDQIAGESHDWDINFFPAANGTAYNYAIQNKETLDDIYQIPSRVRQALEEQSGLVALSFSVIDEETAQIAEAMLCDIQSYVDSGDFGPLWMSWTWMHITGTEYVLAIHINGFDTVPTSELSEEELEKAAEAVYEAFGELGGWEAMDEEFTEEAEG
ncbi:MAG: hypothetical protein HUJ67_01970 [Ruminiclostridium sp.]|nr:hypothetical protein [Ruminiclostridium sp.]